MRRLSALLVGAVCLSAAAPALASNDGIGRARLECRLCHNQAPGNDVPSIALAQIDGEPLSFPFVRDTYVVTVNTAGRDAAGFSLGASSGTLHVNQDSPNGTEEIPERFLGDIYTDITHSITGRAEANRVVWHVDWTPDGSEEQATFFVSAIAANGDDRKSGDVPIHVELPVNVGCPDQDNDGFEWDLCGGADCDDNNPAIKPGVDEICNGADDNCDGGVDEGFVLEACELQQGVCEGATELCDGDGFHACDAAAYGDAYQEVESLCDGEDNDCDGELDEDTIPGDDECLVLGICAGSVPVCQGRDGFDCNLPDDYVDTEATCDGLDNDCDGEADEGLRPPNGICPARGVCNEAEGQCLGQGGWVCSFPAEHQPNGETLCDGLDNDCDGRVDNGLQPPDDFGCLEDGVCANAAIRCTQGRWTCNYNNNHEEDDEVSCDGLDNDCDGDVDEDVEPRPGDCRGTGVCRNSGEPECEGRAGWDCDYPGNYVADERLGHCDNLDNDCDGFTDELCECRPGQSQACGTDEGECVAGVQACANGRWGECLGQVAATPESCDGLDNDCDTGVDEDLAGEPCPLQLGVCARSAERCAGGVLSCATSYPGTYRLDEACGDGLDNDCDGEVDEGCSVCSAGEQAPCGGTTIGECEASLKTCGGGGVFGDCIIGIGPAEEVCDGLDNDCDNQTDEGFPDCDPDADANAEQPPPDIDDPSDGEGEVAEPKGSGGGDDGGCATAPLKQKLRWLRASLAAIARR